jgi:hypothetical protein
VRKAAVGVGGVLQIGLHTGDEPLAVGSDLALGAVAVKAEQERGGGREVPAQHGLVDGQVGDVADQDAEQGPGGDGAQEHAGPAAAQARVPAQVLELADQHVVGLRDAGRVDVPVEQPLPPPVGFQKSMVPVTS